MSLVGMDRYTGKPLSGLDHLRQSLTDILGTPIGSRRERPDYGSNIPRMVDKPVNAGWVAAAQADGARAIARWEPRIKLKRLVVVSVVDGKVKLTVSGAYLGEDVFLDVSI